LKGSLRFCHDAHTREKTDPSIVIYLGNPYSQPVQAKVKNPTRQSKTQETNKNRADTDIGGGDIKQGLHDKH